MYRIFALALVASGVAAPAHAAAGVQGGFAFCTVTDASSAQRTIWASPVFALEHAADDTGGTERGNQVAGEFLAHVATTLGGSGEKSCLVLPDRAGAEALREDQRTTWSRRMYFIKLGDWRDVAWTPAPWSPAATASSTVTGYFHCLAVQTDLPDRSALSRTVATGVFPMQVAGSGTRVAMHEQAVAYAARFQAVVQAHGVPVKPDCSGYDTLAEAQYAHQQSLRYNKGYNMEYTELAWVPDAHAVATPAPVPVVESPKAAAAPEVQAPVIAAEPAPEIPTAPAVPTAPGYYCFAFVTRSEPPLVVQAPVHKLADSRPADGSLLASLGTITRAVQAAHPGKWHDGLARPTCYDNSAVFPGETFCVASTYKRLGGSQMAGLFCNASRETLDRRVEDHRKGAGPAV